MTDYIYIEPSGAHRPAFAMWGLSQDRPLQTATATGWNVPLDLYPDVPAELLEGAFVDGFPYARPQVQPDLPKPARDPFTPDPAVKAALPVRKRAPRKKASATEEGAA